MSFTPMIWNILDCIKEKVEHFLHVEKKDLFSKCSVPWTQSMETGPAENGTFEPPCEIPDAVEQSLTLLDFFYRAVGYDITSCKGNANSDFPSFTYSQIILYFHT